jgi:hypothetical protein
MLEYMALGLLGLAVIGGLLYVTMSPEAEPDSRQCPESKDPKA